MIDIVGGTYREICHEGSWDQLYGSGFRAAAALCNCPCKPRLTTLIPDEVALLANTVSDSFGFELRCESLSDRITFEYAHALAIPQISPPLHLLKSSRQILLQADNVLRFGMVEADAIVQARCAVYDPQSPFAPVDFIANGSQADKLAVVCNRRESRLLTGEADPILAAESLLRRNAADAVVVKCGSDGAFVLDRRGLSVVPAYKTPRVWPLGSGDVFSAFFAYYWAVDNQLATDAAQTASLATAYYCCTQALPVPCLNELSEWHKAASYLPIRSIPTTRPKKVYLAGPFFSMMERWLIDQSRDALIQQGLDVFSPLHDVGLGVADDVVPKDLAAIGECDAMFAILDHLDSGTLFEVGFARSIGKPVVGFCQSETEESLKMLSGSGCLIFDDFVTAVYHTAWCLRN